MTVFKPRNPYALHPLMKKGGMHQKGRGAQRQHLKQQLDNDIDEWLEVQEKQSNERSKERSLSLLQQVGSLAN